MRVFSRFVGGSMDGKTDDDCVGALQHVVAASRIDVVTADDFRIIRLGANGMPMRRSPPYAKETYKMTRAERDKHGDVYCIYELESTEEVPAKMHER
jgi:hypothetical protein